MLPAAAHFDFGHELKQQLDSNTAVVVLSYSLAPEYPYPTQLQQATALVRYLIEEAGKRPENVGRKCAARARADFVSLLDCA